MSGLKPAWNRERQRAGAYLITFVCYGAWLPGQAGAIDRRQNAFGSPLPDGDARRESRARKQMQQEPYLLDAVRRRVVLSTFRQVCLYQKWTLLAAHVRTNHVHVVVEADQSPERVMKTFKAYATRALESLGLDGRDRRRWARHGSTRHLFTSTAISAAVRYVVSEQGEPMEVFGTPSAR